MMAYLAMMAARLVELHRVLKPTGSLYLHCDPTASHYLKIILDSIFGPENFRNEVIWQRTFSKSLTTRQLPNNHDVLLCSTRRPTLQLGTLTRSSSNTMNPILMRRLLASITIATPMAAFIVWKSDQPESQPSQFDIRVLGCDKGLALDQATNADSLTDAGLVVQTKPGTVPQLKRYLDEQRGRPLGDVWADIPPSTHRPPSASATPRKSHSRSWSASSRPAATPATSCSTRSAAAAPPSRPRKSWAGAGSASTSPTSPSP